MMVCAQAAHPRSRGENGFARLGGGGVRGSSPLTRGKLNPGGADVGALGLIPAHAGKTSATSKNSSNFSAHPRSRGENEYFAASFDTQIGSSPLTRGKLSHSSPSRLKARLIPAHAGKTISFFTLQIEGAAHPRSRGENLEGLAGLLPGLGSSPLTRGKLDAVEELVSERRLIPAHAGKTTGRMCRSTCSTAHPRSRGENVRTAQYSPPAGGSSPLTRGKPAAPRSWGRTSRLIPAHAGKTACP